MGEKKEALYDLDFEHPFDFAMSLKMVNAGWRGNENFDEDVSNFIVKNWSKRKITPMQYRRGRRQNLYELVARNDEGQIIGYRSFRILSRTPKDEEIITIDNHISLVRPDYRRKGLGTYLTEVAIKKIYEEKSPHHYPDVEIKHITDDGADFLESTKALFQNEEAYHKYWAQVKAIIQQK